MKTIISLSLCIVLLFSSCEKKGGWDLNPTNRILLQPLVDERIRTEQELTELKVYILDENGNKKYDPGYDDSLYIYRASEYYDSQLINKGIALIKAIYLIYDDSLGPGHGIGTCYLEFPDGSLDTIKIEGERVTADIGAKDRCHCSFPIRNVWVNGKLCNVSEEYQTQHGVFYYEH